MADGYSTRDRAPHQGRGSKTSPSSSPEGARDKGSGMSRRVEAQGKGSAFVRGSDGEHPAGNQRRRRPNRSRRRRACMRELSGCSPVISSAQCGATKEADRSRRAAPRTVPRSPARPPAAGWAGAPPPGWRRRLACCLQKRPAISSESGDA